MQSKISLKSQKTSQESKIDPNLTKTKRKCYIKALENNCDSLLHESFHHNDDCSRNYYPKSSKIPKKNIHNIEHLLHWRNHHQETILNTPRDGRDALEIQTSDPLKIDISQYTSSLEGILINIAWQSLVDDNINNINDSNETIFEKFAQDFSISQTIMPNGIIWVWTPKNLISRMINLMDGHNLFMIDSIVICQIKDPTLQCMAEKKKQNVEVVNKKPKTREQNSEKHIINKRHFDTNNNEIYLSTRKKLFLSKKVQIIKPSHNKKNTSFERKDPFYSTLKSSEFKYFRCSKITLQMFRRYDQDKPQELRHQRNTDTIFDIYSQDSPNGVDDKGKEQVYKIIETLLPNSILPDKKNTEPKLLEIYGTKKRENWITLIKV